MRIDLDINKVSNNSQNWFSLVYAHLKDTPCIKKISTFTSEKILGLKKIKIIQ